MSNNARRESQSVGFWCYTQIVCIRVDITQGGPLGAIVRAVVRWAARANLYFAGVGEVWLECMSSETLWLPCLVVVTLTFVLSLHCRYISRATVLVPLEHGHGCPNLSK